MLNAKKLLNQTAKGNRPRFSMKKLFWKMLQYSRENTCVKFLKTPILKKICIQLLLNLLYEVTGWNFAFGSHLKPSQLSNITKIPVDFKQKP